MVWEEEIEVQSEKLGKACDGNLELTDPNIYV